MDKSEEATAAAVGVLLVEALLEGLVHECHSHKPTRIFLVLPQHQASLILHLHLVVVESRCYHQSPLLHKIAILMLIILFLSDICSGLVFLEYSYQIELRFSLKVQYLTDNNLVHYLRPLVSHFFRVVKSANHYQILHELSERVCENIDLVLAQKGKYREQQGKP